MISEVTKLQNSFHIDDNHKLYEVLDYCELLLLRDNFILFYFLVIIRVPNWHFC